MCCRLHVIEQLQMTSARGEVHVLRRQLNGLYLLAMFQLVYTVLRVGTPPNTFALLVADCITEQPLSSSALVRGANACRSDADCSSGPRKLRLNPFSLGSDCCGGGLTVLYSTVSP